MKKEIIILGLLTPLLLNAQNNAKGYYKDIFIDGGLRLSSRADLPSARVLGLETEAFVSAKKAKEYTRMDTLLQEQCFAGSAIDENGVLLYPDGEPRFRLLYLHGGLAESHGKTLGERGRENIRTFVRNGGSFVGSCAGCYITSRGVWEDSLKLRHAYLGIWPGLCRGTRLSDKPTGISIDKRSPLLRYYDFGGDRFVDSVYHNNGAYAYTRQMWPEGTEILARYDTRGMTGLKREIQGEAAIWAYKQGRESGRVVPCGSHPENVKTGERLDLMCAMVRYALDGNGEPTVKDKLKNGEERVMDRHTRDNQPAYTRIGDKQYHHFTVEVPKQTRQLTLTLKSLMGYDDVVMYLCARHGDFAFVDDADYKNVALDANKRLVIKNPKPGTMYVSVHCATTVDTIVTPNGTQYAGRTDVLNGIPYTIKADY